MLSHCSVFIATSLDGFIARPDGRIDWLDAANAAVPPGEDCGYGAFMAGIDALVMGRHSFETVLGFTPWPYGAKPVAVLSSSLRALPATVPDTVSLHTAAPAEVVRALAARGLTRLYIDGGVTIQRFLDAGLIDDITITTIPVLIGSGRPLFGPLPADVALEHVESRAYDFGFVQRRYRVRARSNG